MIPTPEQIQAAKREITVSEIYEDDFIRFHHTHYQTIQFALRFTAKMMEEPSDGMVTEGQYAYQETGEIGGDYAACDTAQFKAMRDQAIKEINNPRQPDAGL